jgi:mannosylglycerate hydrolase
MAERERHMQTQTLDVHIVSHTHWDREWYLSYEQFRLRLVALVDRMLDLLESRPDFRYFHLDGQTIVLEDYLELRPSQEPRLRKLIEEGRVLIGPWYDMPDEFLVSGEALVRNLARGHRISRRFGTPMPVGYLPDLFGHVSQMPQILRNFGLDNAILWRGFGGPKAEYWWQAPDGSRVLMMHLPPEGYCNATRVHFKPELMIERASKAVQFEAGRTAIGQVLLMNGVDHVEPHPVIPDLASQLSAAFGAGVKHSTLPAYVDGVRKAVNRTGAKLETVVGELRGGEDYANLLPGVLSARVYIKQANARVQTLLEKWAEPLATFATMLGRRYPAEELDYAWKTLLQNHPHDSICGCSVDAVHEENMTRFARAQQVAEGVRDAAIEVIARAVPAGEPGVLRCVAVNPTAHTFAGCIEATVDLPYESAERRHVDAEALDAPVTFYPVNAMVRGVRTHDGRICPVQILSEEFVTSFVMSRYETPWALRARRLQIAWPGEVPPCGYATFDLLFDEQPLAPPARGLRPVASAERSAENDFLRVLINDDGTVDVVDRRSATRYTRCGALDDVGDVGDEYNYSPPENDRRFTASEATVVHIARVQSGPARASFRIDLSWPLPESASADRASRSADRVMNHISMLVSLDVGAPRVTWDVIVDNRSKDHRLRLLFPTGADTLTDVRAETAFGVVRRPAHREVPEQVRNEVPVSYGPTISFVEAGDETAGAIVFGEGLMEYEAYPREEASGARLGLTLLRSVGDLSRDDLATRPSGHAGPGLKTPGAQCLGTHRFRLAFAPRGAEPPAAALFARSDAFIVPPQVVPVAGPGGLLPMLGSFLTLETTRGGVVLSACTKAENGAGLLVRLFNPDDTPSLVRVGVRDGAKHAFRTDFLENRVEELAVKGGVVDVPIAPYRITTIEIA